MNLMGMPLWAWVVFYALVLLMLVADLKMFGRKGQHGVDLEIKDLSLQLILKEHRHGIEVTGNVV